MIVIQYLAKIIIYLNKNLTLRYHKLKYVIL